ncbi:MAG: hypothetical protein NTZ75_06390 [Euryarchaeota archaeon]|nr:hypothetical protein [Euryarchaeota archaeon]
MERRHYIFYLCCFTCFSACTAGLSSLILKKKNTQTQETTQSRYWALLFAVGVYENAPDADRPEMLQACDDLCNVLID